MKKLRLIMTTACERSCEGCCNKDVDFASLPVAMDYSPFDEILLTGGRSDVYPDGGVCRVVPARELSIFLAGVLWADKQHRGKLEN